MRLNQNQFVSNRMRLKEIFVFQYKTPEMMSEIIDMRRS